MLSRKLEQLPPYLFVEIDRLKSRFAASGRKVLDLGIGDPDLGPPPELIASLVTALEQPRHHRYPDDLGLPKLKRAIIDHLELFTGIRLEQEENLVTIGSKEAIAHLALAVVNPGEVVLVPDPGYPVYHSGAVFAGAEVVRVPLVASNGFWPDLEKVGSEVLDRARLCFLNYPNNPTAATATAERFRDVIDICGEHDIILVNDAAYSEITFEERFVPLWPLARRSDIPYVELYSFSKTFSITGWRVGFAVGTPAVIVALAKLKANIDSGVFGAIQEAVADGLGSSYERLTNGIRSVYRERRDLLAAGLERSGLSFTLPAATFYFWIRCPENLRSIDFCTFLLERTGIVATPGVGFGRYGEGYFRLSITTGIETIREAVRRLESLPALLEKR